jgi:nucleoside-diphosphate-sugar epimerase
MTRVLVTGATGFVGPVLCESLAQSGYTVRAALRTDRLLPSCIAERAVTGNIGVTTEWGPALQNVDLVVHAAARAHVLHDAPANSELYMETNACGTQRLAQAAGQAGVRRFVYLSSIKVNGEETTGRPYQASDVPGPCDAYGKSKLQAERFVLQAAAASGMEAVIVRPPLVYGPGVGGNFLRLMRWVNKQWPLPFGSIDNQRSLVNVWNLTDLIVNLLAHPRGAGGVWLVSDGADLSTPDLIRRLGRALQRGVRLLPVPAAVLRLCGSLVGRSAEIARLCGSLTVDTSATRDVLRWSAPVAVDEALARTAAWYRAADR